ncbi:hypothetical protein QR680_006030 [Steinernema hermaphroditum]|uniref:Nuclear receptor domain-containing protein n=1 Tax=Steinernema hermaphroditum TaxID=289476 RepID=A0AA39HU47_9BILA|nr:hypothetical protein QR680_006030 [Steinernema hermaphroditum]
MEVDGPLRLKYGAAEFGYSYTPQSEFLYKSMDAPSSEQQSPVSVGTPIGHLCQVCGAKSHGAHFQVQTCRACAAFFRRTCAGGRSYKCRRATKNCDVSKNAAFNCRYCRFEKCRKVGMKYHGLDEVPSDVSQEVKPRMECPDVQQPTQSAPPEHSSPLTYHKHRVTCDTSPLLHTLGSILEGDLVHYGPSMNSAFRLTTMQRMILSYEGIYNDIDLASVVEVRALDLSFMHRSLCNSYVKYAKFLMSSPHFVKLSVPDRWAIFRRSKSIFVPVEMCAPTIKLYGKDVSDRRLYMCMGKTVNVDTYTYEAENMPDELRNQVNRIFKPLAQITLDLITNPMRELNLTDFELVYLQILLIWNIRSMHNVSEFAKEVAESVVEEISNELHNYYMFELMMTNYASRLVRINSIRSEVEAFSNKFKENLTMAQIFDMFECPLLGDKLVG